MSVFLLTLVGPTALETSLLSLDFVDVVSPPPPCSFPSFTTPPSTLHLHIFFSQHLFG